MTTTHTIHDTIAQALYDAAHEIRRQAETLKREAQRIARTMEGIPTKAGGLATLNPEGEIQGAALDLDRACALLAAARVHALAIQTIARSAGFDDAAIERAEKTGVN